MSGFVRVPCDGAVDVDKGDGGWSAWICALDADHVGAHRSASGHEWFDDEPRAWRSSDYGE